MASVSLNSVWHVGFVAPRSLSVGVELQAEVMLLHLKQLFFFWGGEVQHNAFGGLMFFFVWS